MLTDDPAIGGSLGNTLAFTWPRSVCRTLPARGNASAIRACWLTPSLGGEMRELLSKASAILTREKLGDS